LYLLALVPIKHIANTLNQAFRTRSTNNSETTDRPNYRDFTMLLELAVLSKDKDTVVKSPFSALVKLRDG
jgi:hypothetical protein